MKARPSPEFNPALHYAFLSQVGFYGFIAVCTILLPGFLFSRDEGGLSNFGVHALTIVPFTLAFLVGSICLWLTARLLPAKTLHRQQLKLILTILSGLTVAVLLSTYPYQLNLWLNSIHAAFAAGLLAAEVVAGIWFHNELLHDRLNTVLLYAELLGFVLAALTLAGVIDILFASQILTGGTFGWLMVRTIGHVTSDQRIGSAKT